MKKQYGKARMASALIYILLPAARVFASSSTTFSDLFINLDSSLNQIWAFLTATCYLVGLSLTLSAVYKLKKFGEKTAFMHNSKGLLAPAAAFGIGIGLMYSPTFLQNWNMTIFGTPDVMSTLTWESSNSGIDWADAIAPMIGTVQVIGLIAFLRGWLLVVKSTGEQPQPGAVSKGTIHIVGGVLAINITGTMDALSNTFGL
jgi:intracellular multiplication protein IcmC